MGEWGRGGMEGKGELGRSCLADRVEPIVLSRSC